MSRFFDKERNASPRSWTGLFSYISFVRDVRTSGFTQVTTVDSAATLARVENDGKLD
jgi:hypothetical protein